MTGRGLDQARWRFWVDRGGTFTDVVARDPHGTLHTAKLLSQDPGRYDDAALEAMRRLTGCGHSALPPAELRLGTTVATNALLERAGEPVLLAITRGFEDALMIGTQERPNIFSRQIVRPAPLYASVIAIDERVTAEGDVLRPLDKAAARVALQAAYDKGLRAVAIVLMHGWRHTAHEVALARIAREIGFGQVSVSHKVSPTIRLIARGDTSVADAYLSPVLRRYVEGLEARLGPTVSALYMQSGGALVPSAGFNGKDAVLSGPAGGIVGMAATARQAGFEAVIGFDMGGTSTDVSWYSGAFERDGEARIAGVRIRAPMLRIHTVAAGGGSLCRVEALPNNGRRFLVGPESAGAVPGPACYRRGGSLALTDCNLALGKLVPEHFPAVFGPEGDQPLDRTAVDQRFEAVTAATGLSREQAAEGFVRIAVAQMAHAILAISVRRGHDVSRAALACFGGAGGQHACLVADELGIDTVLVHPLASLLSAYGMGLAKRGVVREATLALPLDTADEVAIAAAVETLAGEAAAELRALVPECAAPDRAITVQIRPAASENAIEVPFGPVAAMAADFAAGWQRRFGFAAEGALVAEAARVEAFAPTDAADEHVANLPAETAPPLDTVRFWSGGAWRSAPLHARGGLAEGATLPGPALVVDAVSTVVIEPGWTARVDAHGNLILTRTAPRQAAASDDTACDPVRLEIMSALFMAVAEEMGAALQHSAASVNIRERLDFSCAVFDHAGNLIANAPHMPVHLGSMGESVRCVLRNRRDTPRGIRPGDAYALNAPFAGGTHLPDITVVMPVFDRPTDAPDALGPAWFVAARGHHADVGGIAPGSMPPDSRTLADEGVVLDDVLLVDQGKFRAAEIAALLGAGPHPARNLPQNLADLRAQLAACARGAEDLRRIAAEQGRAVVDAYMAHVQDHAEAAVRALIGGLSDGAFAYDMDNGAVVRVAVRIDRAAGSAVIDFAGTSDRLPDNFNAGVPIVRAAVLYVVRTLLDGPNVASNVPMNEGCLRPLTIRVPPGSMLDPGPDAAVVAGNVETSQVITDALFGALGAMAAAQGTMNNFTFGDAAHQYYETIAGGSGAGSDFDGTDVVQTHMTNSRLTDPEVLEARFPVLLEEFAIRHGSGGAGAYRGGDGAVRRVCFRQAMTAGILSNRRKVPPFGLDGGAPGACGRNAVERADGSVEELSATASVDMQRGDVFVIETPGGGGFGVSVPSQPD